MPSTRGGASVPPPTPSQPAPSIASSSSLSSGRQDRNSRLSTAQKSTTPHSRSSEEMSEPPRRSQRSHPAKKDDSTKEEHEADEEAIDEEEEVTRCVCGQLEYPGPPLSEAFNPDDAQAEDAGGLFISCDGCSVWQHGGCVGILEESQVPDKYYCEECKPKLHELLTDTRGQNYSLYQPVCGTSSRKASISKNADKTRQDRDLAAMRASTDPQTGKRRATIRSKEHDDEEEQLRRAIEESKRELTGPEVGNGIGRRGGKRAREEVEDKKSDVKRQRRTSEAAALSSKAVLEDDDSDDGQTTSNGSKGKRARADAVQSARQAELREKELEREQARAEAAGRRQERAGRRRADDEPEEETPRPSTSAKTSIPPSSQPESPQASVPPEKLPLKRGPGKKTKKLGNNQYSKTRGAPTSSPPNGKKTGHNGLSTSSGDEPSTNGDVAAKTNGGGDGNSTNKNSPERTTVGRGRWGKGKHKGLNGNSGRHAPEDSSDLSIGTMKRRLEAMAAYIAKAQTELAGDKTPSNGGANGVPKEVKTSSGGGVGGAVQAISPTSTPLLQGLANGKTLEDMSAFEAAEMVSGQIAEWQSRFGVAT